MNKVLYLTLSLLTFPIIASASSSVNDVVSEQYLISISNQLKEISSDIKLQNTMLEDKHHNRCYWKERPIQQGLFILTTPSHTFAVNKIMPVSGNL